MCISCQNLDEFAQEVTESWGLKLRGQVPTHFQRP